MRSFEKADLACLLMALIWGANLPIVKNALSEISPISFNGVRLLAAGFLMLALSWKLEGRPQIRPSDLPLLLLSGLVGNTLYQFLFIEGVNRTLAGNVALLLSSTSIFTALLGLVTRNESLRPVQWAGVAASVTGVGIILSARTGVSFSLSNLSGDVLILAACLAWAIYTVHGRRLMQKYRPLTFTSLTFAMGSWVFFGLALPEVIRQDWGAVSMRAYLELTYSTVMSLAVSYSLWFYAVRQLGSTRAAVYGNLVPLFGLLFSVLLIGEPLTMRQVAGGAMILFGIWLTRRFSHSA